MKTANLRLFRSQPFTPKVNTRPIVNFILTVFRWRWMSFLLLGISSNTMINAIFDYKYQRPLVSISIEEYFNAIVAAVVLLEATRWLSRKLDAKLPWTVGVAKRLTTQLALNLVLIVVVLNTLLVSVTYVFYGGFYAWGDLVVINVSVVTLTFLFSITDTGIYFYKNWSKASRAKAVAKAAAKPAPIQISLGKVRHMVKQESIRCAISQSRSVLVHTNEERRLPYSYSLDALMKVLSPEHFFRANRQTILSRDIVQSIKALEHGKIEVSLSPANGQPDTVVISRTRAADFRKWLKSAAA